MCLYLWEHILGGKIEKKMNGIWSYGFKKVDNIKFKFRTGPGVIPSKVPASVHFLVLTLNGRDPNKISFAKMWLDFLPQLPNLRGVAVLLLGDERCQNDWILPYMSVNKGIVNVTFLVYDSPLVDHDHFFQWPLGVATYRNFPKIEVKHLELEEPRPFICNFVGTIYKNSTRSKMVDALKERELHKQCIIKTRQEWIPNETKESFEAYYSALRLSDLTLSPVGQNTECYRIYEALSLGSIPVVEDVMTSGICGSQEYYRGHVTVPAAPLRLFKYYDAPIIYFSNIDELWTILEKESLISPAEKIKRRKNAIDWVFMF
uniref:Exostosin GT47 domain-containing protein n=1 Tax=Strigamia maritima TaxID=126957 RepID=T1ISL1_STRMM